MAWKLHSRDENEIAGRLFFSERWVEPGLLSGTVLYSTLDRDGSIVHIVEGYAIGTVNPETAEVLRDTPPVWKLSFKTERKSRHFMEHLQNRISLLPNELLSKKWAKIDDEAYGLRQTAIRILAALKAKLEERGFSAEADEVGEALKRIYDLPSYVIQEGD